MNAEKLFYLLILICFQSCNEPEIIQQNKGFLTYSPGYGVTEGTHVASYQNNNETGYILLGSTDNGIEKDFFIVKTDALGNIILSQQSGDSHLDNIPHKVIVKDTLIYILADRYDRIIERTLPYISVLYLKNLEEKDNIYLDEYSSLTSSTYQELSNDFVIDEDKIIITSTVEKDSKRFSLLTYILTYDENEMLVTNDEFDEYDKLNTLFPNYDLKVQSIQKGKNSDFYVGGTITNNFGSNEIGEGYFIIKYDYNGNGQPINTIYNVNVSDKFKTLLGFELDLDNENAIILYRNNNLSHIDVVKLSNINTIDSANVLSRDSLGFVYAVDTVKYDFDHTIKIIDKTKSTSINKIGDNYIITGIRQNDFAMIVDKRSLNGSSLSDSKWGNVWEEFKIFNNISSFGTHSRNNIGNVIQRIDGNGYAIIGTQDFLNDTKIVLMQLDENGNYY